MVTGLLHCCLYPARLLCVAEIDAATNWSTDSSAETMEGNGGERHASNATTASTGGLSSCPAGCSRIEASSTRGEQLSTSIGRGQQRSSRTHTSSSCLRSRETLWKQRWRAPGQQHDHGEHERAELLVSRL